MKSNKSTLFYVLFSFLCFKKKNHMTSSLISLGNTYSSWRITFFNIPVCLFQGTPNNVSQMGGKVRSWGLKRLNAGRYVFSYFSPGDDRLWEHQLLVHHVQLDSVGSIGHFEIFGTYDVQSHLLSLAQTLPHFGQNKTDAMNLIWCQWCGIFFFFFFLKGVGVELFCGCSNEMS